jgi:hypothetical protein
VKEQLQDGAMEGQLMPTDVNWWSVLIVMITNGWLWLFWKLLWWSSYDVCYFVLWTLWSWVKKLVATSCDDHPMMFATWCCNLLLLGVVNFVVISWETCCYLIIIWCLLLGGRQSSGLLMICWKDLLEKWSQTACFLLWSQLIIKFNKVPQVILIN